MNEVEDLITDIGSIVSSVRPGEIMTLKRVEEDYKAIYGKSIPFAKYSYSSLSKFLESFPNHFKFYFANGVPAVRANTRNNITALIARERKSKKPKNFQLNANQNNNCSMRNGRRLIPREMEVRKEVIREIPKKLELSETILKTLTEVVSSCDGGLHRDRLLFKFKQYTGYELKYRDFGFANEYELLCYLNGRVLVLQGEFLSPLPIKGPSLFDLLRFLLSTKTGYTCTCLQQEVSQNTSTHIPTLIKNAGRFSFDEVIEDASARGVLCFDQHFVYGATQRSHSKVNPSYPHGVSIIKIMRVKSPDSFIFEIISNESISPRTELHDTMQRLAPTEPLLTMFVHNCHCSLKYSGEWYRAIIDDICCDLRGQFLTLHLVDFPLELDRGIKVALPTDRLRFLPRECESVPEFLHQGSLAYVSDIDGGPWSLRACETLLALATIPSCKYECYLADQRSESVSVDVVALTSAGDRWSLFQRLTQLGLAKWSS